MKFVSPILGVFVISEILVVLMVECRWLFDSLSKCEWVMSCEVLAEKLSAIICLVVFGRALFQLFLEKGCFPFF